MVECGAGGVSALQEVIMEMGSVFLNACLWGIMRAREREGDRDGEGERVFINVPAANHINTIKKSTRTSLCIHFDMTV